MMDVREIDKNNGFLYLSYEEVSMLDKEQIARVIRWRWLKWIFGIGNALAMLPQVATLFRHRETAGISIAMFWVILAVQVGYSVDGWFTGNRMILWTLAFAAFITSTIIVQYYMYR